MSTAVSLVMCYNAAGELLFGKRRDTGEYTLPGGHADDNESPEDCARRELLEEAGLEAQSLSPLKTVTTPHTTLSFFTAYVGHEPVTHSENDPDEEVESDDWRFVDVSNGLPKRFYDHLAGPDDDKNIVRQLFDSEDMKKFEDEVSTLLQHPNPAERLMALRLDSVNPVHLQTASLDPDPTVHEAAISHPAFGSAQGMHLLEATADASGKPPTTQQLAFLARTDRVEPGHLDAAQRLSQGRLDDTLAKHPAMDPDLIRQMFQDPHVSLRHRMDLLRHPQAPAELLGEVVKAQMLVPSVDSSKLAETALSHARMPHDVLAQLIRAGADPMAQAHLHILAMHALKNSTVPTDLIDELFDQGAYRATGGHAALRYSAASGPSATPEHLERALGDRDPLVWKNLGQAANLQPRHVSVILQRLMAESPRDQAAMQALSGSKAFSMGHLNQMLGQPMMKSELSKAIKPEHLSSIAKAVDPNAYKVVDHTPDLTAHPAANGAHVEAYRQQVLNSPNEINKKTGGAASRKAGITRKAVFQAQVPGEEGVSKFMVKPYHEKVIKRVSNWQKHPHQGWAEMTNQALYHAAGIGHLHQNVSVSEHDMGPGHEKEPALVIHIKPGMKNQADSAPLAGDPTSTHPSEWTKTHQDARKMAVMDMLSNNLDRHGGNLLQGQNAEGVRSLLGVDHSRSFQYIAPNDGMHSPKKYGDLEDSFGPYHTDSSIDHASPFITQERGSNSRDSYYNAHMKALESYQPIINDWWGEVGPKVRQAFHARLEQIKDPKIRAHLKRNFDARADWLDERSRIGIENYGVATWHRDGIPMYRPGQLTDEEKERSE